MSFHLIARLYEIPIEQCCCYNLHVFHNLSSSFAVASYDVMLNVDTAEYPNAQQLTAAAATTTENATSSGVNQAS